VNEERPTARMVAGLQILSSGFFASKIAKFIRRRCSETPYIGGTLEPLKVKEACQSLHHAKIPQMENISKPRFSIKIYGFQEIMSTE